MSWSRMRAVGWPPPKSSPRFSLPGACSGNKHVVSILADFLPWNMSIIRCTAAGSHKRSVKNFRKSWRRFCCSCPAATGLRCCCPRDQGCSWPGFSGASAAEARIRRFCESVPRHMATLYTMPVLAGTLCAVRIGSPTWLSSIWACRMGTP